jgi:hypothetical protein
MQQFSFFEDKEEQQDEKKGSYTKKIQIPIYEPKGEKPHTLELADISKYQRLKNKIINSDCPDDVKKFLIKGASRHIVFNYAKIANFYAHSDAETQDLIEQSALVIIDFDKAIQNGYGRLSDKIAQQYLKQKK